MDAPCCFPIQLQMSSSRAQSAIAQEVLGLPSLQQKCVGEIFGEIRFGIRLRSEISDGKTLVKFWGGLFYLPGKHELFRAEFRNKNRKLRFKFRDFFRKLRSAEGRL